jgi:hydroxyethylthiazole kinase-like uncharacterized protein yjeF
MKLVTGKQIKEWDQFTIANEPVSSLALMERAATTFADWFDHSGMGVGIQINILCGNGNNSGDGLAIGRLLYERGYSIRIYILRLAKKDSEDFDINLDKCLALEKIQPEFIHDKMPEWGQGNILIDALLGTGVSKKVEGLAARIIQSVNESKNYVVSVDMPSGLPAEGIADGPVIAADVVFTFMQPKHSFFLAENEQFIQEWVVGDIGLHPGFQERTYSGFELIDRQMVSTLHKKRSKFGHKGSYGHALICGGHHGKTGAAILSSHAALRSGAGLVTACVPDGLEWAIHATVPELMVTHPDQLLHAVTENPGLQSFSVIGIGPGMGTGPEQAELLRHVIESATVPLVIDADALNIISEHQEWLTLLPENTVLTPHPGEFRRLFGSWESSVEMFEKQRIAAQQYKIVIVLKGAYTRIATPEGKIYINSTGNPGMATAGSGDVLTGVITALLGQGYTPEISAILGVYLHGLAGDLALGEQSQESLCASDLIRNLGPSFNSI